MSVSISVENPSLALLHEIASLGQKSWDDCSSIKGETCAFHGERGFAIEPNFEQYQWLADQGALLIVTLRDGGQLQGYGLGILYRSLHHKPVMAANVDTFYIEPGYRARAAVLIERIEAEFKVRGASIVGWPTSPEGPLCEMLKALGYSPDDVVMEKKLCAL